MKTLKFLFGYARRYTKVLVVTVVSMLLLVGVQLLAPWMIRTMIALVKEPSNLASSMQTILRLAIYTLLLYIARGGIAVCAQLYGPCCRMGRCG